jgi:hypothetical protein
METITQDVSEHAPGKKSVEESHQYVENLEKVAEQGTYYNGEAASHLSIEHRQYLLDRYGTLELDPIPDMGDEDPYNWANGQVSWSLTH